MTIRRLRIALIVSLLVNLFVVGAVAGGLYRWNRAATAPRLAVGGAGRLRVAGQALPEPQRTAYLAALGTTVRGSRPILHAAREARIAALVAFTAPTYDRTGVDGALARARKADFAVRERVERSLIKVAATLSADQRRALAEGLRRAGPLRQPRHPAVAVPAPATE